jgi:hypothetical protein
MMATITVKISPDLAAQLAADARLKRVSKSELVRIALRRNYPIGNGKGFESVYDRTKHLIGILDGKAPRDLSTNKKYLKNFGRKRRAAH